MNKTMFYERLEEIMNLKKGTIRGDEQLDKLRNWDSVALMTFIAFVDEEFSIRVTGKQVIKCQTIGDLVALAGDKVTQ
jgi:acyl carrier protein